MLSTSVSDEQDSIMVSTSSHGNNNFYNTLSSSSTSSKSYSSPSNQFQMEQQHQQFQLMQNGLNNLPKDQSGSYFDLSNSIIQSSNCAYDMQSSHLQDLNDNSSLILNGSSIIQL